MAPIRVQRKRTKGWKMPPNTVSVTRPHANGNPFKVGQWYRRGDPGGGRFRMIYTRSLVGEQPGYVQIKTGAEAVEWFRWYRTVAPLSASEIEKLRGNNLACFCALDHPCHADVLLELANAEPLPSALAAPQNKTAQVNQ